LPAEGLNKVQGMPFTTEEIRNKIIAVYNSWQFAVYSLQLLGRLYFNCKL